MVTFSVRLKKEQQIEVDKVSSYKLRQLQTMAKDSLFSLRNSACVSRPDLCSAKDT